MNNTKFQWLEHRVDAKYMCAYNPYVSYVPGTGRWYSRRFQRRPRPDTVPAEEESGGRVNSAGVALFTDDSVLLVYQNQSRKWSIPKGSRETGETINECWKRELGEECGIDFNDAVRDKCTVLSKINISRYSVTFIYVPNEAKEEMGIPVPKDTNEIGRAEWIKYSNLEEYMNKTNNATKHTLRKMYHVVSNNCVPNMRAVRRNLEFCSYHRGRSGAYIYAPCVGNA